MTSEEVKTQAEKAYTELMSYADHADCAVWQAYPEAWKLLSILGIQRRLKDTDGD